jgi:hypothetical protein
VLRAAALLVWLGLGSMLACRSDADRAREGKLARLAEEIDRLRTADNDHKQQWLAELRALECADPESCGLQDLCVRAYTLHQTALDTIAAAKQLASEDASPPPDLGDRLRATEQQLSEARVLGQRCAEEQVRVVRKLLIHRLP